MFSSVKLGWDKLKKLYQAQMDQHVSKIVKKQSKDGIREACSSEEGAYAFAGKIFFQLPKFLKDKFSEEAEEAFKQEVTVGLLKSMENKRNYNKVFDK